MINGMGRPIFEYSLKNWPLEIEKENSKSWNVGNEDAP